MEDNGVMDSISLVKRVALFGSALLLLGIVLYLAITTVGRADKTPVTFSTFPDDALISIDNRGIKSGTHHLNPGTYQINVEKEGFSNYSRVVVLEDTPRTVAVILVPQTDEAREWTAKNEAAQRKIQGEVEESVYQTGKLFAEKNPIARELPYRTFMYTIGYRMDQTDPSGNSIIIEIDAREGHKQSALYQIRQLGYDPTDFTINFREYENPFPL
jgi:hypothetical protein